MNDPELLDPADVDVEEVQLDELPEDPADSELYTDLIDGVVERPGGTGEDPDL